MRYLIIAAALLLTGCGATSHQEMRQSGLKFGANGVSDREQTANCIVTETELRSPFDTPVIRRDARLSTVIWQERMAMTQSYMMVLMDVDDDTVRGYVGRQYISSGSARDTFQAIADSCV